MKPLRHTYRTTLFLALAALIPPASTAAQVGQPVDDRPAPMAQAGQTLLDDDALQPFRWRPIGPANMAGRVTAIAVPEGTNGKTAYVGYAGSGVWKTVNNGVTWQPIFDDQAFNSIGDVVVAPSDPNVVWVGTGERQSLRSNSWGNGVYKSTNAGRSWEHMGLEESRETGRIVIHPDDPNTVWVAALGHLWGANPERGIYKTTDGGETWDQVLFVNDTTGFVDLKMDPRDPDVLYAASWHRLRWGGGRMEGAGAGSGIWKSTDGGESWVRLDDPSRNSGLPTGRLGRIGLGIAPSQPDRIYAVIQDARAAYSSGESITGGVFVSEDAGATWEQVNTYSAVPDYFYNEVWVDPNDPDRAYFAATVLGMTTDGGETIESQRYGGVHVDNHAMWIDPADSEHILLGNDGGVYESWDRGRNWMHHPMPVGQFYEVAIDSSRTPYHVCGGLQDNGTWCGPSATRERDGITTHDWYSIYGGDGFVSEVSVDSPHIRYAESQYGNMGRINTMTWDVQRLQPHSEDAGYLSGYEFRWDWNTPFVISKHDPTQVYLGSNHLFRLRDRGADFDILGPDMTRGNRFNPQPDSAHTSYRTLHSIAESAIDRRVIWTGSNDGLIWRTTDWGETWTNLTGNLPTQESAYCWVGEIEASIYDVDRAYVVHDCHRRDDYGAYVYRTDDGGRTWTDISGNLPDDAGSYVVRESHRNPDVLFFGNERGVYMTTNGGAHWTRLDNGLPTAPVRDMDIMGSENDLVAGTFGRSVYILDISAVQEMSDSVLAEPAHLFPVEDGRIYNRISTYASSGDAFYTAPNPPYGVTITYRLTEDLGREARLTIRRVDEETGEAAGSPVASFTGSGRPGMYQETWSYTSGGGGGGFGGFGGGNNTVEPGLFEVRFEAHGKTMTRRFRVEEGWPEASSRVR